jgi:hypothetical protein
VRLYQHQQDLLGVQHRRRRGLCLNSLVIVLGTLTACSASPPSHSHLTQTVAACPPAAVCTTVTDSTRLVTYLGSSRASGSVLWFPGGPGLRLPDVAPRHIQELALGRDVLVLTPHGPPGSSACGSTTTDGRLNPQVDWACLEELAVSPTQLAEAVADVVSRRTVDLVYAESFGATRLAASWQALASTGTALFLDSPAPPPAADAAALLAARAAAAQEYRAAVSDLLTGAEADVLDAAALASAYTPDILTQGPSSGVRGSDARSRLHELAEGFQLSQREQVLGRAADDYYLNICLAFTNWPAPPLTKGLNNFLARLHQPCRDAPTHLRWPSASPLPSGPSCLIASSGDGVVPMHMLSGWRDLLPRAVYVQTGARGHRPLLSPEVLGQCRAGLERPPTEVPNDGRG